VFHKRVAHSFAVQQTVQDQPIAAALKGEHYSTTLDKKLFKCSIVVVLMGEGPAAKISQLKKQYNASIRAMSTKLANKNQPKCKTTTNQNPKNKFTDSIKVLLKQQCMNILVAAGFLFFSCHKHKQSNNINYIFNIHKIM
jgi:hypothetical protein